MTFAVVALLVSIIINAVLTYKYVGVARDKATFEKSKEVLALAGEQNEKLWETIERQKEYTSTLEKEMVRRLTPVDLADVLNNLFRNKPDAPD